MHFAKYVSYETGNACGFNGGNDVYQWLIHEDGLDFHVYHTKWPLKPRPNIVVLDRLDKPSEFYFRTFYGTYPGEEDNMTDDEEKVFFNNVRSTFSPEFRVEGKDLEEKLLELVKSLHEGTFTD